MLNYMRTGQYYLNRGGPYAEFFPEVLRQIEGRSHVDYAFHLAPMQAGLDAHVYGYRHADPHRGFHQWLRSSHRA